MESYADEFGLRLEFQEEGIPRTLPRSTVLRVIKENLPTDFTHDKEFGNLMIECGNEFIKMVTSVGHEISEKSGMSTITPQHIVTALIDLGYQEYAGEGQNIIDQTKFSQKKNKKKQNSISRSGLSEEDLLACQEKLFEAARKKLMSDRGIEIDKTS